MKIYEDEKKRKEIEIIYFGIVKAGDSKTITVYIYNDGTAVLTNLEFKMTKSIPEAKQIKIINPPITIQPDTLQPLKLKWSPARTFKKALEIVIVIEGEEIYLAKRTFRVERKKG